MARAPSRSRLAITPALLALALSACGGDGAGPDLDAGADAGATDAGPPPPAETCNPLAREWECLLPWPSDVFRVDGRLSVPPEAMPRRKNGTPVDVFSLHEAADGFALGTQILALFPGGVDPANLPGHAAFEASLAAASPTVLLDAETGERVPHFAELDVLAPRDDLRALILRPVVRLREGTRYVVGLRGLRDLEGADVAAPEGFRRLRDGEGAGDVPRLDELATRYEADVFAPLAAAGVAREELQLAWDFTTRSREDATGDLLAVRDDLLARLAAAPPEVRVVSREDDVSDEIARTVVVALTVPLYLESAEPGARLFRDAAGRVTANGEVEVEATVQIPRSVAARAAGDPPARVLQFGHGFFGSRGEAEGSFMPGFADARGFVVAAADWWGMSTDDLEVLIPDILTQPHVALRFTDRVHQAMANFIALAAALGGPIAALPELATDAGPSYDPSAVYFMGISQGHILGGTYVALSPHVERAVLGVGGANLSFMEYRAGPFDAFLKLAIQSMKNALDVEKYMVMTQTTFDRIDPLTYAPMVLAERLPGAPASRRVLMHLGVGDASVPNLGTELHARVLGLPLLAPSSRAVLGLEEVAAPVDGSALVTFDFHEENLPSEGPEPPRSSLNTVHEDVRRLPASQAQVDAFFRPDGLIEGVCDGPCDPE